MARRCARALPGGLAGRGPRTRPRAAPVRIVLFSAPRSSPPRCCASWRGRPHRAPTWWSTRPDRGRGAPGASSPRHPCWKRGRAGWGSTTDQPESVNDEGGARAHRGRPPPDARRGVRVRGRLIKEPLLSAYPILNVPPVPAAALAGRPPRSSGPSWPATSATGVCIMRLTAGLDNGPVCPQPPRRPSRRRRQPSDAGPRALAPLGRRAARPGARQPRRRSSSRTRAGATLRGTKITAEDRVLDPGRPAASSSSVVPGASRPTFGAAVTLGATGPSVLVGVWGGPAAHPAAPRRPPPPGEAEPGGVASRCSACGAPGTLAPDHRPARRAQADGRRRYLRGLRRGMSAVASGVVPRVFRGARSAPTAGRAARSSSTTAYATPIARFTPRASGSAPGTAATGPFAMGGARLTARSSGRATPSTPRRLRPFTPAAAEAPGPPGALAAPEAGAHAGVLLMDGVAEHAAVHEVRRAGQRHARGGSGLVQRPCCAGRLAARGRGPLLRRTGRRGPRAKAAVLHSVPVWLAELWVHRARPGAGAAGRSWPPVNLPPGASVRVNETLVGVRG